MPPGIHLSSTAATVIINDQPRREAYLHREKSNEKHLQTARHSVGPTCLYPAAVDDGDQSIQKEETRGVLGAGNCISGSCRRSRLPIVDTGSGPGDGRDFTAGSARRRG